MPKLRYNPGTYFLALGLLIASIGGWKLLENYQFAAGGVQAEGVVIDLDRKISSNRRPTYQPVIEFRDANGGRHVFTAAVGKETPEYHRRERVPIVYDPASPGDAKINTISSLYEMSFWALGLGLPFAGIGWALIYYYIRRCRLMNKVKRNGILVQAEFQHCLLDAYTKEKGINPYYVFVEARHPTTGKITSFKSGLVWRDLGPDLKGKSIPVRVDPNDPKLYWVDLTQWVPEDEFA